MHMKKEQRTLTLLIAGIAVALAPFLGIPQFVRSTIIVVGGLVVAWLAYEMRKKENKEKNGKRSEEEPAADDSASSD
jgi:small neutral amino acid transporter SnatA (MarC family)